MHLAPDEVHVWVVSLDGHDDRAGLDLLAPEERRRATRMDSGPARVAFVAGRVTLRSILSRYVGVAPSSLGLAAGLHGKPFLEGGGDLQFNLSHTGSTALYAVTSGRPVGIDVERLDRPVPALRLARRFFSRAEHEQLLSLPEAFRQRAFLTGWVRKEAVVKAWGLGLSAPLDRFDVCLLPDRPARLLEVRHHVEGATRWSLCDIDAGEGHAAALAVAGPVGRLSVRQWRSAPAAPVTESR